MLEVGFVLDRRLDPVDAAAAKAAVESLTDWLRERFPGFEWRLPTVERESVQAPREEPVTLLELAASELSLHHWDFALAVTSSDLETYARPSAWAVSSRALGTGVISTFRLDPVARRRDVSPDEREQLMRRRLHRLALCILGHLVGLSLTREGNGPMSHRVREQDLDTDALEFDGAQTRQLEAGLTRVADERVEEQEGGHWGPGSVARTLWRARREIWDNIRSSRCWEFPFRLARLSTAAVSALAIVSMTAECWELGTSLGMPTAAWLAVAVICVTSVYVLQRQRLLSPIHIARTEQAVVTRTSVLMFVFLGMLTIYATLAVSSWGVLALLFAPEVVSRWTGLAPERVDAITYLGQALFVSSAAVLVGALGASFEGQSYVKHVAWVDVEI